MIVGLHGDKAYMREARKQATYAYQEGEIPIGVVVNIIVSQSYNQIEKHNDVTAHAEILAITAAENYRGSKYLSGYKLYVTIEPCTMCVGLPTGRK